jgi:uncharacterized protein YjcR
LALAPWIAGGCEMIEIDKQQFEEMYYAGCHAGEIAEHFGSSHGDVTNWMRCKGYFTINPENQK